MMILKPLSLASCLLLVSLVPSVADDVGDVIWLEGENPVKSSVFRHPWYHQEIKRELLSGGDFISHFSDGGDGTATYRFELEKGGPRVIWLRANPVQSLLLMALDGGQEKEVDLEKGLLGETNLAADGKPDLRFVAWCKASSIELAAGEHEIGIRFASPNSHHGSLDCLVVAPPGFQPNGILKPDEIEKELERLADENKGWFPWVAQEETGPSLIDLRGMNESFAGEHGGVIAKGDGFVYRDTGKSVRFWGVNGPPHDLSDEGLADCARMLASRGVNLVRLHGAVFDRDSGKIDTGKIAGIRRVVAAMKKEGIYSHLSIYFPLWMTPKSGGGWREGYDGQRHPFGLIYFDGDFQALHRSWMEAVLGGKGDLLDDPAVFGIELVNEDSLFFWTFQKDNIPSPHWRRLERDFSAWVENKYGSRDAAVKAWDGVSMPEDGEGRLGLRPLYQIVHERTMRDQDTAAFLYGLQQGFYEKSVAWLEERGFQGMVTASNWSTADARRLGPLEKMSYLCGDFVDRHGYFSCEHKGQDAGWSIRDGHSFRHRRALAFESEDGGMDVSHPVIDPRYGGRPSMISETTHNRPNRFRAEAPWIYAAYGRLQGSDAVVHFALDSSDWSAKPGFFMQPWTLMSPTQMGQFPAAAVLFRGNLLREGDMVADCSLSSSDALALKGSPLHPAANLDELRKADAEPTASNANDGVDPLIYFVGQTALDFDRPTKSTFTPLARWIDREKKTVASTTGELSLDYGRGILELRAPGAQGLVGDLAKAGRRQLPDLEIESALEIGAVVAVALDGRSLADSRKILLQVMSEEKPSGFVSEKSGEGRELIKSIGGEPWLAREFAGRVRFLRSAQDSVSIQPLGVDGRPVGDRFEGKEVDLLPGVPYYLLEIQ